MTDNEIVKALECCTNDDVDCKECPCDFGHTERRWCDEVLMADALDLINRQKAEIEAWKETAETAEKAFESWHRTAELNAKKIIELKAEIERLKEKHLSMQISLDHQVYDLRVAKAEAIKDFLQKQEIELANNTDISAVGYQSIIAINDKILKEMEGDV